jgi:hypothetical protein
MDEEQIEQAYNETFPGLTMYYRDCDMVKEDVAKFKKGQVIIEPGFTDLSSFAEGLDKNVRFAVTSNNAKYLGEINPDVAKWNFCLIHSDAYYKVLDIYQIENKTQILLLHFDEKYLDIFKRSNSNIEDQVIEMGRKSFDHKNTLEPNEVLYEEEWLKRTMYAVGMREGKFFKCFE